MHENLLGYLLGALDGPEHEQVRQQIERDPQLREQLNKLENSLAPLEHDRWQHEPPAGLAAATCQLVAQQASSKTLPHRRESGSRSGSRSSQTHRTHRTMSSLSEWNPRKHGWDRMDMIVAAGIFVAAALLFFPAIANSRRQARMLTCQNNLRTVSLAMSIFSERHNGVFPYIPTSGKFGVAGFYAPQLVDDGLVTRHPAFLCPSAPMDADSRNSFRVPTIEQIRAAEGPKLNLLQHKMGGSYMYNMGHFEHGSHRSTINLGRTNFPIMADEIQDSRGERRFGHGGKGINVMFEGGNVRFIIRLTRQHEYFISKRGLIEAGVDKDDCVLGHSWTRPSPSQSVEAGVDEENPMLDHHETRTNPSSSGEADFTPLDLSSDLLLDLSTGIRDLPF